jgi:hypothetical protein
VSRPAAIVAAVVAVVVGVLSGGAVASAVEHAQPRRLATEACEEMVRSSAVAAAGQELTGPQRGAWKGDLYTCTYPFAGGPLVVRVRVFDTVDRARARFAAARSAAGATTKLYGIGQAGFVRDDGLLTARKDNFVLTVDGRKLPADVNDDTVTWSTTRAIFDCW